MVGEGETVNQERNVVEGVMWFRGGRGGKHRAEIGDYGENEMGASDGWVGRGEEKGN